MRQSADQPAPFRPESRFVDTLDGRYRVRVVGDGPTVLCLHGVSAQGRSWLDVARALAHRATFVLPDLIGRGESSPAPNGSFTLEEESRRVERLRHGIVEEIGVELPGVLAGHSQGAAIALSMAARESGVRGLLLCNPVTPWTKRPQVLGALRSGLIRSTVAFIFSPLRRPLATAIIRRAGGPGFDAPLDMVEAYAAPYADIERARTLMGLLRDWQPGELRGIRPIGDPVVRVVSGALDPRVRPRDAGRLASELGGTFRLIEDGAHVLPEQHPAALAEELGWVLDAVHGDGQVGPSADQTKYDST